MEQSEGVMQEPNLIHEYMCQIMMEDYEEATKTRGKMSGEEVEFDDNFDEERFMAMFDNMIVGSKKMNTVIDQLLRHDHDISHDLLDWCLCNGLLIYARMLIKEVLKGKILYTYLTSFEVDINLKIVRITIKDLKKDIFNLLQKEVGFNVKELTINSLTDDQYETINYLGQDAIPYLTSDDHYTCLSKVTTASINTSLSLVKLGVHVPSHD